VATLALDVVAAASAELAYELHTSADSRVASGRVQAPPSGSPLLLLVPAAALAPDERYVLVVRDAASDEILGEFRFLVAR
jgi:hypothetical protein